MNQVVAVAQSVRDWAEEQKAAGPSPSKKLEGVLAAGQTQDTPRAKAQQGPHTEP